MTTRADHRVKTIACRAGGLLLLAALALAPGCLGYRVGSSLPPGVRFVYVPVFLNEANYPDVETEATKATIQALQLDGTLKVKPKETADVILNATLTSYALTPITYNPNRPTAANEYRMTLKAKISLTRINNNKVVVAPTEVTGETTFILSGDMAAAQQTALPDAAKDLAKQIVDAVVEYW